MTTRTRPTVVPRTAPRIHPYYKPAFEPERICPLQVERFKP